MRNRRAGDCHSERTGAGDHSGFEKITVKPTSTSIYSATCFIRNAIFEDLGGLGREKRLKGYFSALKLFLKKNYLYKYFPYYLLAKPVIFLIPLLLDKRPCEGTKYPIGWVASGMKPGQCELEERYSHKQEFLERKILKNGSFALFDGVIKNILSR